MVVLAMGLSARLKVDAICITGRDYKAVCVCEDTDLSRGEWVGLDDTSEDSPWAGE